MAVPPPDAAAPGRLGRARPIAIVDIGSNSVRLVVYEGRSRAPTPLYNEKLLCGLGRGVATTGRLPADAMERALEAISRFRALCEIAKVEQVHVLATAAARDAKNAPGFLKAAAKACGRPIELLTGEREAELSALGVLSSVHRPDGVVGDLGGGSLELVDLRGGSTGPGATFPLGGLTLRDMADDSPKKAARIARDALARAPQLAGLAGRPFYAVGGTWRALAKLQMAERDYPLRVLHNYELDVSGGLLAGLDRAGEARARQLAGLADQRRPLLAYGAVVLDEIVRAGRPSSVTISALGVREGLLFERLDAAERALDPLLVAAGDMNLLRSRSPRHGHELVAWTDAFARSVGVDESADERRLRHAACLLADIGWRAHPDYRAEQTLGVVANASFLAIDHPGRAYVGVAIYLRHAGLSPENGAPALAALASPRLLALARLTAALMRIAYPVSVAMAGVLPRAPLLARNGALVLSLPRDLAPLASERLENRLKGLGRTLDREARIEVG